MKCCFDYIFEILENPIVSGIFSSICIGLGLYLVQIFRYYFALKRKFHNQQFEIFYKNHQETPLQSVRLRVRNNIIEFYGKRNSDGSEFTGQFIVNPINLKIAEGFHNHTKDDGFGFMKMIIRDDNNFLVEAPFTMMTEMDKEGRKYIIGNRRYQAFNWSRKL